MPSRYASRTAPKDRLRLPIAAVLPLADPAGAHRRLHAQTHYFFTGAASILSVHDGS